MVRVGVLLMTGVWGARGPGVRRGRLSPHASRSLCSARLARRHAGPSSGGAGPAGTACRGKRAVVRARDKKTCRSGALTRHSPAGGQDEAEPPDPAVDPHADGQQDPLERETPPLAPHQAGPLSTWPPCKNIPLASTAQGGSRASHTLEGHRIPRSSMLRPLSRRLAGLASPWS